MKVSKYNWSHGHASRNTVTVCWYKSFKICCCLLQLQWTQISICRGFVFCPLQPAKCATDRVYNKSTSTVWHFIFLPCKSNEALIDSLHWFNLASPGWNTALLSDGNLCVCVYTGCGCTVLCGVVVVVVVVGRVGMGFCGFGCTPWDGCTAETGRLCLQCLSARSGLPAHHQQDLMGLSCPRSLQLYRPQWHNNSAYITSVALIEILYLLNLHYCWRVAEFLWGMLFI